MCLQEGRPQAATTGGHFTKAPEHAKILKNENTEAVTAGRGLRTQTDSEKSWSLVDAYHNWLFHGAKCTTFGVNW